MGDITEFTVYQTRSGVGGYSDFLTKGLRTLGVKVTQIVRGSPSKTKHVACWGWRVGQRLKDAGHEVLVMERGYLGDRFSYTSLGWNGLNGYAVFPSRPSVSSERFNSLKIAVKPWHRDGENVLILGQVPRDMSLKGMDMEPLYESWATNAWREYRKPVFFRPHPDLAKRGLSQSLSGAQQSKGTLQEALAKAFVCITYNSNSSVDAVLAGVPTVAFDKGSMAYDVCTHKIKEPVITPDRTVWLAQLAWKQWTEAEICSGEALKEIIKMG